MKEKECSKCHEPKAIKEFSITGRGKWKGKKRHYWCKQCVSGYDRQRWKIKETREKKKKGNETYKIKMRRKLCEYLDGKQCTDCEETNILTFEFDHVRGIKKGCIGHMITKISWENILKEIAKCDIVCANCHRIRTANRGGWAKLAFIKD